MDFEIKDDDLERVYYEAGFTSGFQPGIIKVFCKRMQQIAAARDERLFYELKGIGFEKLKGKRSHQRSMKLNDQWRLILEIRKGNPGNKIVVVGIEDYH